MSNTRKNAVSLAQFLSVYIPAVKNGTPRDEVIKALDMNEASFNSRLSDVKKKYKERFKQDLPALKGSGGGGKRTEWADIDALVAEQLGVKPATEAAAPSTEGEATPQTEGEAAPQTEGENASNAG